jgi:hypothetical protein
MEVTWLAFLTTFLTLAMRGGNSRAKSSVTQATILWGDSCRRCNNYMGGFSPTIDWLSTYLSYIR